MAVVITSYCLSAIRTTFKMMIMVTAMEMEMMLTMMMMMTTVNGIVIVNGDGLWIW